MTEKIEPEVGNPLQKREISAIILVSIKIGFIEWNITVDTIQLMH